MVCGFLSRARKRPAFSHPTLLGYSHCGASALWLVLSLPLADLHIETDDSVLVAQGHNRHVPGDVIFNLDDLLAGNRNVRAVGNGQIAGDLLFDCDLRPSYDVGFTSQPLRIDLDSTDPK